MITEYPIHLTPKSSRSSKPDVQAKNRENNKIVERIENYVNELIKNGKRGTVRYSEIEANLGIPSDFLGKKCQIDGGSHGFTISKEVVFID